MVSLINITTKKKLNEKTVIPRDFKEKLRKTTNRIMREEKGFLHKNWKWLVVSMGFAGQKFPLLGYKVKGGIWQPALNKVENSLYHSVLVTGVGSVNQSLPLVSVWRRKQDQSEEATTVRRPYFPFQKTFPHTWVTLKNFWMSFLISPSKKI